VAFANSQLAAAFGAETGIRAAYLPGNWSALSSAERSLFLKRFAITHVHVHGDLPAPAAGVAMVRVEGCAAPLWAFAPRQSF